MKLMRKITPPSAVIVSGLVVGLLGLMLTGCPARRDAGNGSQTKTVHVAANLPLTGELGFYGTSIRDGVTMAQDDLKEAEPGGPTLQIDWQDDAGDPKTAVTVMQKQYLEPPNVYISGPTQITFAVQDQVNAQGTPHFVGMFYPVLNAKTTSQLRVLVSYRYTAEAYLPYTQTLKPKRVAIPYIQTESTERLYNDLIVPGLKKQGAQEFLLEPFGFGKKDFKDIAVKIQAFQPDLLLLDGYQPDMVGLVRALRPLGLIKDGRTLANFDMMDAATVLSPQEMEGIRVVAPLFASRPEEGKAKEWRPRFKARYNRDANYYDAFAYDMAQIIHDAAKRVSADATSAQWLAALRATEIPGVTGPLKFDSTGDLITPVELGVYRGGKLVPAQPEKTKAAETHNAH